MLEWKKAKKYVDTEMPQQMKRYSALGAKPAQYKAHHTINYVERMLDGVTQDEVDAYHIGFGKLFKWLKLVITTRKQDIIRRKALAKKAVEDRETRIAQSEERAANREQYLIDMQEKFNEDHREEIEAFERFQEDKKLKESEEYGEEADDGEDAYAGANQEPPVMPVFDQKEAQDKFDDENPEIVIPPEVKHDIDNDWVLTEDEEQDHIAQYWAAKEAT